MKNCPIHGICSTRCKHMKHIVIWIGVTKILEIKIDGRKLYNKFQLNCSWSGDYEMFLIFQASLFHNSVSRPLILTCTLEFRACPASRYHKTRVSILPKQRLGWGLRLSGCSNITGRNSKGVLANGKGLAELNQPSYYQRLNSSVNWFFLMSTFVVMVFGV